MNALHPLREPRRSNVFNEIKMNIFTGILLNYPVQYNNKYDFNLYTLLLIPAVCLRLGLDIPRRAPKAQASQTVNERAPSRPTSRGQLSTAQSRSGTPRATRVLKVRLNKIGIAGRRFAKPAAAPEPSRNALPRSPTAGAPSHWRERRGQGLLLPAAAGSPASDDADGRAARRLRPSSGF